MINNGRGKSSGNKLEWDQTHKTKKKAYGFGRRRPGVQTFGIGYLNRNRNKELVTIAFSVFREPKRWLVSSRCFSLSV